VESKHRVPIRITCRLNLSPTEAFEIIRSASYPHRRIPRFISAYTHRFILSSGCEEHPKIFIASLNSGIIGLHFWTLTVSPGAGFNFQRLSTLSAFPGRHVAKELIRVFFNVPVRRWIIPRKLSFFELWPYILPFQRVPVSGILTEDIKAMF
jgi:hypothetical protein